MYLENLHDYKKAIVGYEKALKIKKNILVEKHDIYHFMRLNYSKALLLDGQYDKSILLLEDTISTYLDKINSSAAIKRRYTLARAYAYKGLWYLEQNRFCEAEKVLIKSIPQFADVESDNDQFLEATSNLKKVQSLNKNNQCSDL